MVLAPLVIILFLNLVPKAFIFDLVCILHVRVWLRQSSLELILVFLGHRWIIKDVAFVVQILEMLFSCFWVVSVRTFLAK